MTATTSITLLYGIIETVIFLIPLGALIWKAASLASRVSKTETDIKDMKTIVEKQNEAILATLKDLNTTVQELKVEVAVIKAMKHEEINITKEKTEKRE
jgi:hypothetical protein